MSVDIINSSQNTLTQMSYATSVASENINNASNPNYSRQVVEFSNNGAGVVVASPVRMSNSYLNQQVYETTSDVGYTSTVYQMANSVDTIVTGISVGPDGSSSNVLQQSLIEINEALINLVSDDSYASRSAVLSRVQTFIDSATTMTAQLNAFEEQIEGEVIQTVKEINHTAKQIANVNEQLLRNPNDVNLLTQRDELLNDLSEHIAIDVHENENGSVNVTVAGGYELVRGGKVNEIEVRYDEFGDIELYIQDIKISDNPEKLGGSLGGNLSAIEDVVKETERMIGKMVVGLSAELNNANMEGFKADGSQGTPLVTIPDVPAKSSNQNTGDATVSVGLDESNVSDLSEGPIIMTKTPAGYEFYDESTGETEVATSLPANVFGYEIDSPTGTMNDGDTFEIDPLGDMLSGTEVTGEPDDIAAAGTLPVEEGDNSNLVNLSNVMSEPIFNDGQDSVTAELANIFVEVGNNTVAAENNYKTAASMNSAASANWANYSGVSVQEEELNIMQYQHVYQSVSKVINTVDDMFNALLDVV
ncbi:flagellar hook-associated protein FlgK [Vibrio crassostreae]|uniref:flagellar hook-associated protein FlgK n=1 Tax=Vibrio crassostreae TaxID=246167 RepID=UPI001B312ED6|nr:flagellar basal body rod C-terminal domain-containing protein [Vibrio crassostreae]